MRNESNYPCYFRYGLSIMCFKSFTKGLLVSFSYGKYEMKEVALDEEWIDMFMVEGDEVSHEDFADMVLRAANQFETYWSTPVEIVAEKVEDKLVKTYSPWHSTTAVVADLQTYFKNV